MKTKIIKIAKIALGISLLIGVIYSLWQWPWATIFGIIALGAIIENWSTVKAFAIVSILSMVGGFIMIWLLHLLFTGELLIEKNSLWSIGYLFCCIYALGLVIEEDQQRPYIWLWKQFKKLKYKKFAFGWQILIDQRVEYSSCGFFLNLKLFFTRH